MKVLVTGINGFVGNHLVHELAARREKIIGLGTQPRLRSELSNLVVSYHKCDLTDPVQVNQIPLEGVDAVINLAGLAKVGDSYGQETLYNRVNVGVLAHLGERIVKEKLPIRVIAISSGNIYDSQAKMPLSEDSPMVSDGSPYAISKILMEEKATELRKSGLDCIVVRAFNHIGPGQEEGFLIPDMIAKIRRLADDGGVLMVGNLETKRDFTDVRDISVAYADLATADKLPQDLYNVCSGRAVAGKEIVAKLLKLLKAEDRVVLKIDKSLLRPNDSPEIYGSYDRLKADTGWEPKISLEKTLADTVADV